MSNDNKFAYILIVLMAIFVVSFGTLILTAIEQPPETQPLTFSHRWGICSLSMSCDHCLEEHNYLNSSLSICWELQDMDRHVEIFGR